MRKSNEADERMGRLESDLLMMSRSANHHLPASEADQVQTDIPATVTDRNPDTRNPQSDHERNGHRQIDIPDKRTPHAGKQNETESGNSILVSYIRCVRAFWLATWRV